jgi:hypothetical protein
LIQTIAARSALAASRAEWEETVRLKTQVATTLAFVVALAAMALAAPPPQPGFTPMPSKCKPVGYQGQLAAVGTIKLVSLGTAPAGTCSQIRLTAWRNNFDYTCNDALTPHESATATGPNLVKCAYNLPVEMGHMVSIRATTAIPGWRVVLTYNDSSETSPAIWEEKHPVTIDWLLKGPVVLGPHPTPPPHLTPLPHKAK